MALPPLTSPSVVWSMPNPMDSLQSKPFIPQTVTKKPVLPKEMDYMHNNFSPEIFTGKTTSEKIASGEVPSTQVPESELPLHKTNLWDIAKKGGELLLNKWNELLHSWKKEDVLQSFLDDPNIEWNKKREALKAMNENPQDEQAIRDHITQKYYPNSTNIQLPTSSDFKMHETIPTSWLEDFKMQRDPNESVLTSVWKTVANFPANLAQIGLWTANLASTAIQETWGNPLNIPKSLYNTAVGWVINPTIWGLQNYWKDISKSYDEGGLLNAANTAVEWASKFAEENPAMTLGMIKPKSLPEIASKSYQWIKNIAPTLETVKNIPSSIWNVIKHPIDTITNIPKWTVNVVDRIFPWTKEKIAWFDPQTKYAFENSTPEKVTQVLKDAEDAKINPEADYNQTPFHKWMEEGAKTLETVNSHIWDLQDARMKTLENSGVPKIDQKVARETLAKELEKNNVASISVTKDGTPIIESKPGRDHTLWENPKDIEAYQKLQNLLSEDVSPVQMMDRIHNLQSWMYDNATTPLVKGISGKMESIVKKVTGSLNETFKNQLPKEYREILGKMEEEIKMKQDIKRVFGIDDKGNPVRNIGEWAMKRLANGTTTSGEARALAKLIKEKFGFDLIREARLRQASMEIVWDPRAASLFDVLSDPKKWLKNTIQEWLVDKKSTAMKLAWTGKDPIIPKEPTIPKTKENVWNNRSNPASTPNPKIGSVSNIPWAQKTTVEVPSNPKGNQSKTLAWKQWVMVEEQKLLTSGKPIKPTKKK